MVISRVSQKLNLVVIWRFRFLIVFFNPKKFDPLTAVDQQTKARDELLMGSGLRVPAGQPRPYLVIFLPNFAKSL